MPQPSSGCRNLIHLDEQPHDRPGQSKKQSEARHHHAGENPEARNDHQSLNGERSGYGFQDMEKQGWMQKKKAEGKGNQRKDQPLCPPDPDSFNKKRRQNHGHDEINEIEKD